MLSPRKRRIPPLAAAVIAAGVGLFALLVHYRLFVGRAGFPLDLEWMEGGTLLHALRLSRGQPLYLPPSVEFIPFLYTPLYPAVLAALSHVLPLGYALGRTVSILAFTGALTLLCLLCVREGKDASRRVRFAAGAAGIAAAGAVVAGFGFTGTFFDLVRADSLLLMLQTLAVALAFTGRSLRTAALAGVFVALAFFTKQTASVVGVAIGASLLVAHFRRGLVYGAAAALVLGAGIAYMQARSDGWFWTYIFELHQSHDFNRKLAFVDTPMRLLRMTWPTWGALLAGFAGLAWSRRLERRDLVLLLVALAGFSSACVGFGTRWAFENAFIPAVFFPALAAAVWLSRLLVAAGSQAEVMPVSALATIAGLLLAGQVLRHPRADVQRWVPVKADRAAAQRFLQILSSLPGDGFVPFHPYYNVLVGKAPHVHRMGVMDVAERHGRPRGLDEAIAAQTFPFVILDWKSRPGEWPGLEGRYHVVHEFRDGIDAARSFSGAETSPRQLLYPTRAAPPLPAGATRIADFEAGAWQGWQAEGEAFSLGPSPVREQGFGRFMADSGAFGPEKQGILRSPPIVITGSRLRFHLAGAAGGGLRVALTAGPETPHEARPDGGARFVEWDVSALRGQTVTLVIEDRSPKGVVRVDEIAVYDPPSP